MVTDNQVDIHILYISFDIHHVEESFSTFCTFWDFILWKCFYKLTGEKYSIDHTPFGSSWVHTLSLDMNLSPCSIEALILKLSYMTTIHSICPLGTKFWHIKLMGSLPDLLIRSEGYSDFPMLNLRMCQKIFHSRYDLCHPCLVISS